MHATVGCLACLVATSSIAFATSPTDPAGNAKPSDPTPPTYYLRGYYRIDSQRPVWQDSDAAPWSEANPHEQWVNRRLVKWGYVPFTHAGKNYYCLIDDKPRTGSHVSDVTFLCGEPAVVESIFIQNNGRPNVPMIGGGAPLESSLRPRPASGN